MMTEGPRNAIYASKDMRSKSLGMSLERYDYSSLVGDPLDGFYLLQPDSC